MSDPLRGYNFLVTILDASTELMTAVKRIDRMVAGGFSECSGLESTIDIEEIQEGGNNGTVLKFPTRAKTGPLKLKRGVAANDELWDWHNGFVMGRGRRRDGLIVLQDESRQPAKIWAFHRGIPTKYTGPTLNALDSAVAIEELQITHEGLALISTSAELGSIFGAVRSGINTIRDIFD